MRIAAIDIGTNSLHMIVCRVRPDFSFDVVDREKEMIRLGAGGLEGRRLSDASMAAAVHTLSKFLRIAAAQGADEVVAAATSAVREAANGADFVRRVRQELGLHVRVISGAEEARLIHLAVGYAVDLGRQAATVIDIGGGSTEITVGTAERLQLSRSFKLGVIRLTERFVRSDPISRSDERRLVRHIRRQTGAYLRSVSRRGVTRVIGTSGTILSLGALAAGARANDDVRNVRVGTKAIGRLRRRLTRLPLTGRLRLPNFDPRRADLAPAGVVLLDTLLEDLGAADIALCDYALREGLVLDYVRRNAAHINSVNRYPDPRRRSVVELAERCNYLPAHAQQVARLALAMFDATRDRHGLGEREREWLEYGALLHDIGTHISYERHHKHSYYLIQHGGLRGFDPAEVEMIGLVARYHRQAVPRRAHRPFGALPRDRRRAVRLLGAMVRLAEGLDRSHAQVITGVTVTESDEVLTIQLEATGDPELELWAAGRHAAALAAVLDVEIRFAVGGATETPTDKDAPRHAGHPHHPPHLSRPAVRGRRHRRVRQDDATRAAG
jgi:exopolyphosphatase/guanosine-5'-triphosphate,3'-diphosphate pyrophosphatase